MLGAAATTDEGESPVADKELDETRCLDEPVAQVALTFKRGKGK